MRPLTLALPKPKARGTCRTRTFGFAAAVTAVAALAWSTIMIIGMSFFKSRLVSLRLRLDRLKVRVVDGRSLGT